MHVGIIMDGNRRWAKSKGFPSFAGHKYGANNLEKILDLCPKKNIQILTVYALSTENIKRDKEELKNLFELLEKYLGKTDKFVKKNIKLNILGNQSFFPEKTQEAIQKAIAETEKCDGLIFNIALNYGGRDEIVRAVKRLKEKNLEVNEENLQANLDTGNLASPDLIIRTGGDCRLSNFLLWQASYATLYFTSTYWPAFNKKEFKKAMDFFKSQKQNYGR